MKTQFETEISAWFFQTFGIPTYELNQIITSFGEIKFLFCFFTISCEPNHTPISLLFHVNQIIYLFIKKNNTRNEIS